MKDVWKQPIHKLASCALMLAMVSCLLPVPAMAAESNGLELSKTATYNETTGQYDIQLEAYTTGTAEIVTTTTPMDIVFVLDQSDSMSGTLSDGTNKNEVLKSAVNNFIAETALLYTAESDHRIALVEFDTGARTLKGLTEVDEAGAAALTTAVNGLTPGGYADIEEGMNVAQTTLGGKNTDRKQVVIVFTDGRPDDNDDKFDEDVASGAIKTALTLKDYAKIYAVGMFNEANPDQINAGTEEVDAWWYDTDKIDAEATNRYINFMSSNSSNADSIGIRVGWVFGSTWKITKTPEWSNKGYYVKATDADALTSAFNKIQNTEITATTSLTKDAVLKDVISENFKLPNATIGAINVQVAAATRYNMNKDKFIFGTPTDDSDVTATLSDDGKTIEVTGFDYNANVVVNDGSTVTGKKLIVTFSVIPEDDFGGGEVPTSTSSSGIYDKDNKIAERFPLPTVEVPLKEYDVVFKGRGGTPSQATKTVLHGETVSAIDDPSRTGYTFEGWHTSTDGGATLSASPYDFTTQVTGNLTLYAKWVPIEYKLTVNYVDKHSNGNQSIPISTTINTANKLKWEWNWPENPDSVADYSFMGWCIQESGTGATLFTPDLIASLGGEMSDSSDTLADAELTYYAIWEETEKWYLEVVDHYLPNSDYSLLIYYTDTDGRCAQYDGAMMYDVSDAGYVHPEHSETATDYHKYAIVIETQKDDAGNPLTAEAYLSASKVTRVAGNAAGTVTYGEDVNDSENIDLNDLSVMYGMVNARANYMSEEYMLIQLGADVDGSKRVDDTDIGLVKTAVDANF